MPTEIKPVIVKLLRSLGSRKEVEQYLKQYSEIEAKKFAIIKVGGGIIQDDLDSLISSLTFLQRVGLLPIVIHGAGPQLNSALSEAGISTEIVNGQRVTSPETLEIARKVFQKQNLKLVEALEKLGTRARPITSGIFEADLVNQEELGLVGKVTDVHIDPIASAIRSGHLPILACLGETSGGQILNINADIAARQLALRIEPYKIVFLTPTGGLLDEQNRIIETIHLEEEFDHLMTCDWVSGGMQLKLKEIKDLLYQLPLSSSVSITSPDHLAKELFTYKGSGTLIRRGERVIAHPTLKTVDEKLLAAGIASCFGRALVSDYFQTKNFFKIYATDSYRGMAVLTEENGVPYMDKFAVTNQAQGEGLGGALWARLLEENPKLFWRSRNKNPINNWYFQQAHGSYKDDTWTIFWVGLDSFDEIKKCIEHASQMPATLESHVIADSNSNTQKEAP